MDLGSSKASTTNQAASDEESDEEASSDAARLSPHQAQPFSRRRACPIWPSASHSLPSCVMLAKSESVTWMRG